MERGDLLRCPGPGKRSADLAQGDRQRCRDRTPATPPRLSTPTPLRLPPRALPSPTATRSAQQSAAPRSPSRLRQGGQRRARFPGGSSMPGDGGWAAGEDHAPVATSTNTQASLLHVLFVDRTPAAPERPSRWRARLRRLALPLPPAASGRSAEATAGARRGVPRSAVALPGQTSSLG